MQLNKSVVRASSLQCWSVKVKMPLRRGGKTLVEVCANPCSFKNFGQLEKTEFTSPKPVSSILSLSHFNHIFRLWCELV